MLGSSRLDFGSTAGVVQVTREQAAYRQLRLHVGGTPLQLSQVRVVYADGDSYAPTSTYLFDKGSWTHHIALPSPARVVDRVEFAYQSTGRRTGNSTVRLFGQH